MTLSTIPATPKKQTRNEVRTYTVREAAEMLGLSVALVRLRCHEGKCPSVYHEFPGTGRGFYLLTDEGLGWLRANSSGRQHSDDSE